MQKVVIILQIIDIIYCYVAAISVVYKKLKYQFTSLFMNLFLFVIVTKHSSSGIFEMTVFILTHVC
jgi:hypothetical protein